MKRLYGILALLVWLWAGGLSRSEDGEAARHWAFQNLKRLSQPRIGDSSRCRTPVDAFLLARLEVKGLSFSADAGRQTLIRRAYLDLIGLPPAPEEIQEFLQDIRPDAYERLLDRLLASPHFGERWGRHWLDEAGYVDVTGTDNDATIIRHSDNKWRFRDYVIASFNEDKPFDCFLVEQLAGDELVDWRSAKTFTPQIRKLLIASGFLRMAADDTAENELNTPDIRYRVLHQTIESVSLNLLGLTLQCAKCHNHKYEPISQSDYYAFQALFQPAFNPDRWLQPSQRQLADASRAEKIAVDKHNAELERAVSELKKRQAKLGKSKDDEKVRAGLSRKMSELEARRQKLEPLQAVYDVGPPTVTRLLRRGDPKQPRAEIPPGFLKVLCTAGSVQLFSSARPQGASSGRRLALARWLTQTDTPAGSLVLRVRVNRVWQHLFGTGIVPTSENFGVSGLRPSHPELLEWLSCEFRDRGQRLKPFLKLLMTSTAYRQASRETALAAKLGVARQVDPDNLLLWRMPLRRLESEIIRDCMLAAAGKLERQMGGPPTPVAPKPDGTFIVKDQDSAAAQRRSIYLLARRNYHPTLLNVFDQPNLTMNCTRRTPSAVVLQSLTMLNDAFVLQQAGTLAERVARQSGPAMGKRIDLAFQLVLCRPPGPEEITWSRAFWQRQAEHFRRRRSLMADRQALEQLCHMLLNTSEFLYIP